jgi:FkbM family methyltransferase
MKTYHRFIASLFRRLGKPRGFERFVTCLMPEKKFVATDQVTLFLQGAHVRLWPRSRIGWNLFCFGDYESELRVLFRHYVPEGGTVVEVGANVGWHCLLFSQLVGHKGCVHAFEPNKSVYGELCHNLNLNNFKNVKTWDFALSSDSGTAVFHGVPVNEHGAGNGYVAQPSAESDYSPEKKVRLESFDALDLKLPRLDFVKIDVEGAENDVLTGMLATIAHFSPVIVFEHLEDYNERCQGKNKDVVSRLAQLGYTFHAITPRKGSVPLSTISGFSGDILALPSKARLI